MEVFKINDNIEVSVDFSFEQESDCETGCVETLGGPYTVDNWYTYYYMHSFDVVKVLIDGKEINDYTKELSEEQVNFIDSEVTKHGEGLAENMAEEMECGYCEEPDDYYDEGYMYEP